MRALRLLLGGDAFEGERNLVRNGVEGTLLLWRKRVRISGADMQQASHLAVHD